MKIKGEKSILVTGSAGFIGYHLCSRLIKDGNNVVGIDNLNDYYDVKIKIDRLKQIEDKDNFKFLKIDIIDKEEIEQVFIKKKIDVVVHLAAQAGVRYSLVNPHAYIVNNVNGFLNILEGCRHCSIKHLVYASSSSVYGLNTKMPFSVSHNVDHPVSLYAATKKANELMAHAYSYLYSLPTTGLRFFTVYGPWGRPDMALFLFTEAILNNRPIDVFNYGKMQRDITYIDDIVEGIIRVIDLIPQANKNWNGENPDPSTSCAPYKLYNIGNNNPVELLQIITILEDCLGKKAQKNYLPLQPGDVPATFADINDLMRDVEFKPSTPAQEGISNFVEWYKHYYRL